MTYLQPQYLVGPKRLPQPNPYLNHLNHYSYQPNLYVFQIIEYLDGLERLRDRLGLSKQDAKKLLGFAARTRIGPVVKVIIVLP